MTLRICMLLVAFTVGFTERSSGQDPANDNYGFYTDRPGYAAGETIVIRGNWPKGSSVQYRLHQITKDSATYHPDSLPLNWGDAIDPADRNWRNVSTTNAVVYNQYDDGDNGGIDYPIPLELGSLAEFPLDMSNSNRISLEGWVYPTYVPSGVSGEEDLVILGQIEDRTPSGSITVSFGGGYGLGITSAGKAVGYLATDDPDEVQVESNAVLPAETWTHLALTYNGSKLKLWVNGLKQTDVGTISGKVATTMAPLRLGGKKEAPGLNTGLYDGKVDNWTVWNISLPRSYIRHLNDLPAGPPPFLNQSAIKLKLRFEDAYGTEVADSSIHQNDGFLINHGTPGVGGRNATTKGLRLNYDQLVDADWPHPWDGSAVTPITIPVDDEEPSGLYVIEALVDGVTAADISKPLNYQCVIISPDPTADPDPADVAVVVPVNTWLAYNGWPGHSNGAYGAVGYTSRSTNGVVGNNSAYKTMGDNVSIAHYHGWRRPNIVASPYHGGGQNNIPEPIDFYTVLAPAAVHFTQWVEDALPTLQPHSGTAPPPTFHFFTDWDMDSGSSLLTEDLDTGTPGNGTSSYRTWVTLAHHEYWSEPMVDHVDAHLGADQTSGTNNLLNIAGNVMMWRCDIAPSTAVMETRKWPARLNLSGTYVPGSGLESPQDAQTLIGGGDRSGHWRFLQQAEGTDAASDPMKDFAFGTLPSTNAVTCNDTSCGYGQLMVINTNSYLWDDGSGGKVVNFLDLFGITDMYSQGTRVYCGGHEHDRVVPDPDNSMIPWEGPHVKSGTDIKIVSRLTDPDMNLYPIIDRDHDLAWMPLTPDELKIYELYGDDVDKLELIGDAGPWWNGTWISFQLASWTRNATISDYETTAGGRVVSVPTTAAVWSLGAYVDPAAVNPVHDPLTLLTLNAFRWMVFGSW